MLNQELAMEVLGNAGMEVTLAVNGQEAVDLVESQEFDGILMDIQMPVMDGYTATREIRKKPGLDDLPIIAITANAMAGDRDKALAAGMNDHIPKPLDVDQALATLAKWIKPATPSPEIRPERNTESPEADEGLDDLPGVDTEAGLKVVQGDTGMYRKLLTRFVEAETDFAARFQAALDADDLPTANRCAHSLKGVAGSIGALALQAGCRKPGTGDERRESCRDRNRIWRRRRAPRDRIEWPGATDGSGVADGSTRPDRDIHAGPACHVDSRQ